MNVVVARVTKFARDRGLVGPGVVAVSGGADSVALLRALVDAGITGLVVAHLNHKLRGDESDADEQFVRELAAELEVTGVFGVADLSQVEGNIEAAARDVRYAWLDSVAAEHGAGWIATGHTADDQAETVLHRIIRGSGLQGLRGIADERRGLSPPKGVVAGHPSAGTSPAARRVVRPMLAVTRAEIVEYLSTCNQPHREDRTNADVALTRNRIRHELLPLLREFNPQVVPVLGRLADQATLAFARLDEIAEKLRTKAEKPRAGDVLVFDAEALTHAGSAATADVFRIVWQRENWPADDMTAAHWKRLANLADGDYPGGVRLDRAGAVVRLGPRS